MKGKLRKIFALVLAVIAIACFATACNAPEQTPEHTHAYSNTYSYDTNNHWFECECGEDRGNAPHIFVDGKCVCGYEKEDSHTHEFETVKFDDNNHWKECSCGEKSEVEAHELVNNECSCGYEKESGGQTPSTPEHVCSFDRRTVDEKYLKSNATCEEKAKYYYSCSCGKKGSTSFENGSALGHSFTNYVDDGNSTKTATCDRSGCGKTNTITIVQNGITFKTLSVNGTSVNGKVNNATSTFSFLEEVITSGEAKYAVSLDIYGTNQVLSKTVPLSPGNNTMYVFELLDGETTKVYEVNIYRKHIYTVRFNTNGGSSIASQQIEEESFASHPKETPTKIGYTFDKWDFDFGSAIMGYTEIDAVWTANTNTAYKVEHYLQNLENDNYTKDETLTDNLTGTTASTVTATAKSIEHFTHTETNYESGVVAANGSTVLKVYYTRDVYTVTFNGDGGELYSGEETQSVKYGGTVIAPVYRKVGYHVIGWDKVLTGIAASVTINPIWEDGYTRYGDYIEFGTYPQTIKEESVTVGSTANANGYYEGSDGELYAKVVADAYDGNYKFTDGTKIVDGTEYYFKVEPIRWRILSEDNGKALILCDSIIGSEAYQSSYYYSNSEYYTNANGAPEGTYANNYQYSGIRAWLNNEFYNTAFSELERELINTVEVDNSIESTGYDADDFTYEYSCANTFDKVFLLSYEEATNSEYGMNYDTRSMTTSDYARATYTWMYTSGSYYGNGSWWLRSPYNDYCSSVWFVNCAGSIYSSYYVSSAYYGFVPALEIQLS